MTHRTKWSIDPNHTTIGFTVIHLMISGVKGCFGVFDGNIYTKGKDFSTAEAEFWIAAASLDTGLKARDEHLVSVDFLDAAHYPQIHFISESITSSRVDCNHQLWGILTIKGISKNICLNLAFGGIQNDLEGNQKAGFTLTGTINRSDWDMTWNKAIDTGGLLVGEEVFIACDIELIKSHQSLQAMQLVPAADKNEY